MNIVTSYDPKSVATDQWDWSTSDLDNPESFTAYGATEKEALNEFIEHIQNIAYAEGRKDEAEEAKRAWAAGERR